MALPCHGRAILCRAGFRRQIHAFHVIHAIHSSVTVSVSRPHRHLPALSLAVIQSLLCNPMLYNRPTGMNLALGCLDPETLSSSRVCRTYQTMPILYHD